MPRIIVAGHLCLDIIPDLQALPVAAVALPGRLNEVGALTIALGGAVANTGLALHLLGGDVGLVGLCGTDFVGNAIYQQLYARDPQLVRNLTIDPRQATSYSVVVAPSGQDRAFWYFPGTTAQLDLPHIMPHLSGADFLRVPHDRHSRRHNTSAPCAASRCDPLLAGYAKHANGGNTGRTAWASLSATRRVMANGRW